MALTRSQIARKVSEEIGLTLKDSKEAISALTGAITQALNAVALPLVFYYLIRLTSDRALMGKHHNTAFQKWFAIIGSIVIILASGFALTAIFIKW